MATFTAFFVLHLCEKQASVETCSLDVYVSGVL